MHQKRKMNVYVVSTSGYEQKFFEVRNAIFDTIRELGMNPIGYEQTTFISEPHKSLYENCKNNMGFADLFLVLVNERYGYLQPEEGKSVTHYEIEQVRRFGKPYLMFVQEDVVDVLDSLTSQKQEDLQR